MPGDCVDTFENANPPQEQDEMVIAKCWECGRTKLCHEHIVCCTGTHFHTCPECRATMMSRPANTFQHWLKLG